MSDFSKVLIKDDRLVCSPEITYAVIKGAMNNTVVPFDAISGTNAPNPSSITWNVQVPSEQIIIDRNVVVESVITVEVAKRIGATGVNEAVWNCGVSSGYGSATIVYGADALNVLPFHQLVNSAQVTINNTSVSMNVQDVLPALIRFNDSRYINEMKGFSTLQYDKIGSLGLTTNGIFNAGAAPTEVIMNDPGSPFATYTHVLDEAFIPRGAFPVNLVTSLGNSAPTASTTATAGGAVQTQFIQFTVRESLMVSPFIWACPRENSQGIYGVQNLSIVLNLSSAQRLIRSRPQMRVGDGVVQNTNGVGENGVLNFQINSCRLLMNFLTPQPSDLLVPRNVVPYQEFPRYFGLNNAVLPAGTLNGRTIVPGSVNVSFNSLQLNQIPDKLIIYTQPLTYNSNTYCSDHFAPIRNITINFNNQSGLLSTWTRSELYRASRLSGSAQSWFEFSGVCNKDVGCASTIQPDGTVGTAFPNSAITAPTSGSLLVLEFGTDIELPDYYAPGSLGNFNLQFNITFENYALKDETMKIVAITMNSGVFVTEKGQSSVYTGLLTKQDVLEASSMEPITQGKFRRMVGGSFWDTLKSIGSKVWKGVKSALPIASAIAQQASPLLGQYGAPIAMGLSTANKLVNPQGGAMGYGMSGGRRKVKAMVEQ